MKSVLFYIKFINKLNDWIGQIVSFLIYPIMGSLLWEVIMRYAFNEPTQWAHEFSSMLYAIFFLIGGVYALRWNAHVSVEIFYQKFPKRMQAAIDLCTWSMFYLFFIIILWKGSYYAWGSVARFEISSTVWGPPIWPIKIFIPLAALLFILQGLCKTMSDVVVLFTGRDLMIDEGNITRLKR